MTSMRKADLGFWMNLPPGWVPIDPKDTDIPAQVAALVQRRVDEDPEVAKHRGRLEQQIRQALKAARSTADLSFAALLATFTPDGLPIAASLTLTRHPTPDGVQAQQVLAELGEQAGKTNSLFEVPFVGTVVRSEYLERTTVERPTRAGTNRPGEVSQVEVFVVQYYLPTPVGNDVLIATGTTQTLPLREVFAQLFDAIISTFQFVDDGSDSGGM